MIRNAPPIVHLSKKSGNVKTGKIPVSTSGRNTCPDACPLKKANGGKGCYGEGGPLLRVNRAPSRWSIVAAQSGGRFAGR